MSGDDGDGDEGVDMRVNVMLEGGEELEGRGSFDPLFVIDRISKVQPTLRFRSKCCLDDVL